MGIGFEYNYTSLLIDTLTVPDVNTGPPVLDNNKFSAYPLGIPILTNGFCYMELGVS